VFTRREAWEWLTGPQKQMMIMMRVCHEEHPKRPRVPDGLSSQCASMLRRCLHHEPSRRPSAKQLTQWLGYACATLPTCGGGSAHAYARVACRAVSC
jgi:hypothetical protein